jgi:6-pyruvoyltetrahydropterin/6-carboxytetrahydropterin synthase
MSKWIIDKTFEFCYGHRVWTQTLNGKYSNDLKCACRHLHGHEGKMQVFLTAPALDQTSMITDFRHLEWLKKWINTYIDHQFVIDRNDPLYNKVIGDKTPLVPVYVPDTDHVAGYHIDPSFYSKLSGPDQEYYEGFMIVDFVPTSERLSAWMAKIVEVKMKDLGVTVHHIDWWETPKSRSVFYTE